MNHFVGKAEGIEQVQFADDTVWNRDQLESLLRLGYFNAVNDVIRFADEDQALAISADQLTRNDADEGTQLLRITQVGNAVNSTVVLRNDQVIEFLGAADFHGDAFFDYTVSDAYGRQSTARAEVNILPVNDRPAASDDGVFSGLEDTPLQIAITDLLANDADIDGDLLTLTGQLWAAARARWATVESPRGSAPTGNQRSSASTLFPTSNRPLRIRRVCLRGPRSRWRVSHGVRGAYFCRCQRCTTYCARHWHHSSWDRTNPLLARGLMSNDIDPEGDDFSIVDVWAILNGEIQLRQETEANGGQPLTETFVDFTPHQLGPASLCYTVRRHARCAIDGNCRANSDPLNDPPIARDDAGFETIEDQPLLIAPERVVGK